MSDAAEGIGATAGLVAREIDRARRDAPAAGHPIDEPCANCGVERCGPYCHACGQAGHVHRNLMGLVHDVAHGVFHFEGKIWHTLPLLAWRPGELTRRYVHGERAKFVSPMALFLFSVFLMFAVVSSIGHHGPTTPLAVSDPADAGKVRAERQRFETKIAALRTARAAIVDPRDRARVDVKIANAQRDANLLGVPAGIKAVIAPTGERGESEARARIEKDGFGTGVSWFDHIVGHAAKNPELAAYKLKSYGYKYSWALIPISLPFLWLLFAFRRDVGLYDHAIFAIYSLSFMSLAVVALVVLSKIGLATIVVVLAVLLVPPVHMYRQLKGAYLLGRWGAGWRTAALLFITTITSGLFLAFLAWMGSD